MLAAVFYLVLFVLAIFGVTNVWLYLLACLMSGIGTAFIFLLVWVLATDAIDYNKVTYGLNDEATSYAFYSFMRKLGQTVATILINVPLLVIGYNGSELKRRCSSWARTAEASRACLASAAGSGLPEGSPARPASSKALRRTRTRRVERPG